MNEVPVIETGDGYYLVPNVIRGFLDLTPPPIQRPELALYAYCGMLVHTPPRPIGVVNLTAD